MKSIMDIVFYYKHPASPIFKASPFNIIVLYAEYAVIYGREQIKFIPLNKQPEFLIKIFACYQGIRYW